MTIGTEKLYVMVSKSSIGVLLEPQSSWTYHRIWAKPILLWWNPKLEKQSTFKVPYYYCFFLSVLINYIHSFTCRYLTTIIQVLISGSVKCYCTKDACLHAKPYYYFFVTFPLFCYIWLYTSLAECEIDSCSTTCSWNCLTINSCYVK